jgi:hypothetical protein
MQNAECKMQNGKPHVRNAGGFYLAELNIGRESLPFHLASHSSFCILHSAFCISPEQGARMAVLIP